MQRKLFIIRHGKSSWESVVDDIDRPLTERGVNNSYDMAARMLKSGQIPEVIYTSPANRAQHTAMIMAKVWALDEERIHVKRDLYLPDSEDIAELIFELPDSLTSVALFGHNPGFTHFANRFLDQPLDNVPTAGVVIVSFDLESWTDIFNATIGEVIIDCPKNKPSA